MHVQRYRACQSHFLSTSGSTGTLIGINNVGSAGTANLAVNNFISIVPSFNNASRKGHTRRWLKRKRIHGRLQFSPCWWHGFGKQFVVDNAGLRAHRIFRWNNIILNKRTGGTGNHFAAGDQSANTGTWSPTLTSLPHGCDGSNFMDYGTSGDAAVSFA
jgi:hypothetical protein